MIDGFLIPLITVGLAELADKTQLAVFALSSKTKKHFQLLLGVILAFAIADGLAIVFGKFMGDLIPVNHIKIISGSVFILFGLFIIFNSKAEKSKYRLKNPFLSGFSIILLSELGDKTQIASALFATKFNPVLVFLGVMTALTLLSILAIIVGKYLFMRISETRASVIGGIIFILAGIYFFI